MRSRFVPLALISICLCAPLSPPAQAQSPRLRVILKQLKKLSATNQSAQPVSHNQRPLSAKERAVVLQIKSFQHDLQSFAQKPGDENAAARWMALFSRYLDLLHRIRNTSGLENIDPSAPGLTDVLSALPTPETWNAISEAILQRPLPPSPTNQNVGMWQAYLQERSLRRIAYHLADNIDGQFREWTALNADLARLRRKLQSARNAQTQDSYTLLSLTWYYNQSDLNRQICSRLNDPAQTLSGIEVQIEAALAQYESGIGSQSDILSTLPEVFVPDTPGLTDLPATQKLFQRLILSQEVGFRVPAGSEVERFIRQRTIKLLSESGKVPNKSSLWNLVSDSGQDSVDLYTALIRRFPARPKKRGDDSSENYQVAACRQAIVALIRLGRVPEAIDLTFKQAPVKDVVPQSGNNLFAESGHLREWYRYLAELLRRNPNLPHWHEFVNVSGEVGRSDEALTLARRQTRQAFADGNARLEALQAWAEAALANDDVAEGLSSLRETARYAQKRKRQTKKSVKRHTGDERNTASETLRWCGNKLLALGTVLNRPELRQEGLRLLSTNAITESQDSDSYYIHYDMEKVIKETSPAQAENLLLGIVENRLRHSRNKRQYFDAYAVQSAASQLIGVYDRQRRWPGILFLLREFPFWDSQDLSGILTREAGKTTVGMAVAHALAATGQTDKAAAITRACLAQWHNDADYAFYLKLVGSEAAIPYLDKLAVKNRFDERPLIWKAVAAFRLKRYTEAEKSARAAIQVDPSDGNSPHGDRMRAYAVLAEIRQAQGDAKEADSLRHIVQAIRVAENADDLEEAGLTKRAIRQYEKALTFFDNAYCIQSRLAVNLASLGKLDEAAVHFQKAYELMPDSFGRQESHCFGCEGAFTSPQAQGIAEKVLTRIAGQRPDKPQVYYLLGYLQFEQKRYAEAAANLWKATKLDPDYINAYVKLASLRYHIRFTPEERETLYRNLRRFRTSRSLDLRQYSYMSENTLPAIDEYWNNILTDDDHSTGQEPLFPLRAVPHQNGKSDDSETNTPMRRVINEDVILQQAIQAFDSLSQTFTSPTLR